MKQWPRLFVDHDGDRMKWQWRWIKRGDLGDEEDEEGEEEGPAEPFTFHSKTALVFIPVWEEAHSQMRIFHDDPLRYGKWQNDVIKFRAEPATFYTLWVFWQRRYLPWPSWRWQTRCKASKLRALEGVSGVQTLQWMNVWSFNRGHSAWNMQPCTGGAPENK